MEVVIVILLVSIASLFLFRGYSVFLRASGASSDYLRLQLFLEEKVFHLKAENKNQTIETRSFLRDDVYDKYKWGLMLADTVYPYIKQGVLKVGFDKRKQTLDVVVYFR